MKSFLEKLSGIGTDCKTYSFKRNNVHNLSMITLGSRRQKIHFKNTDHLLNKVSPQGFYKEKEN